MKKVVWLSLIVLGLPYLGWAQGFYVNTDPARKFKIAIEQDDALVPVVNHEVTLKKAPFKITVALYNHDGVFMSASFGKLYYDQGDTGAIKDYAYLNSKAMVESNFNEEQTLIVASEALAYLFYDPTMNWHRFDRTIIKTKEGVIGRKTVTKIFDKEQKQEVSLSKLTQPIYLFFLATEEWGKPEPPKELGRQWVKVNWQ